MRAAHFIASLLSANPIFLPTAVLGDFPEVPRTGDLTMWPAATRAFLWRGPGFICRPTIVRQGSPEVNWARSS